MAAKEKKTGYLVCLLNSLLLTLLFIQSLRHFHRLVSQYIRMDITDIYLTSFQKRGLLTLLIKTALIIILIHLVEASGSLGIGS